MNKKGTTLEIEDDIKRLLASALEALGISVADIPANISLEFPAELAHGDYASNIALMLGKKLQKNPREFAGQIVAEMNKRLQNTNGTSEIEKEIEKIETAGPGFINFHLSEDFFAARINEILKLKNRYGWNDSLKGKKVLFEYTDPNPFKVFHIGHLMSNAIGESLSRLFETTGAKVKRANYQGDVGLHVAKAIYGMQMMKTEMPSAKADKNTISSFLGNAYAAGATMYDKDEDAKAKIHEINKKVYDRSDKDINKLYDIGKRWSLEHFEEIYEKLGTHFDYYFFESDVAGKGKEAVEENTVPSGNAAFEKSDGAIVFKGEKFGLHTRVFITKDNLPTYETKEIGLNARKFEKVHPDLSVIITAEEQREYFRVVLKAMEQVFPEVAAKTRHVVHGMLVLPSGKMSSRTGDVITGESLITDTIARVKERMVESKKTTADIGSGEENGINDTNGANDHDTAIATQVAIGAIKYMILRQSPGRNIVYEVEKSLSLDGDSGPYLQYSVVRAQSVLEKAKKMNLKASVKVLPKTASPQMAELAKIIARFPHIVHYAQQEYAPNDIATHLIQLASLFNSFYANEQIANNAPDAGYKVALTAAFVETMRNGLWLLGIETPVRM